MLVACLFARSGVESFISIHTDILKPASDPERRPSTSSCNIQSNTEETYRLERLCSGISTTLLGRGLATGNVRVVRGLLGSRHDCGCLWYGRDVEGNRKGGYYAGDGRNGRDGRDVTVVMKKIG